MSNYKDNDLITIITQDGKLFSFRSFLEKRSNTFRDLFFDTDRREKIIPLDLSTLGLQKLLLYLIEEEYPNTVIEWAETLYAAEYLFIKPEFSEKLLDRAISLFDDFYDLKFGKIMSPYYDGPLNQDSDLKTVMEEYYRLAYDPNFY